MKYFDKVEKKLINKKVKLKIEVDHTGRILILSDGS